MCDALSRHSPKLSAGVRILPAYWLAHGRRQLVEGAANFPEGCRQLFWREPRAPLDNNVVERALKKAILHRKNSLFYKTLQGAQGGDLYMSLIPTCELNGANPLDYLTELQRHSAELSVSPAQWMPWNYRDTLAPMATAA